MIIKIRHTTHYTYGEDGRFGVQRLNLTPRDTNAQQVHEWNIEAPGIDHAPTYFDGFGNKIHLVSQVGPRECLTITGSGTVETQNTDGVVGKSAEPAHPEIFLRSTPLTELNPALAGLADAAAGTSADPIDILHELMNHISDNVAYEEAATHAATTAAEALHAGRGVCQDHAHIFIAGARHLETPARYVTGYLRMAEEERAAAHHAWAEAWIPNLGWVGFDAANRSCPTDHYVRLGCGFDAQSAAPISGTRIGGSGEVLSVDVFVEQQQQ